jgi:hypothetical protein
MLTYDPERAPNPQQWLALDEQLRFTVVEKYHRAARIELPDSKAHALFHAFIENQIAMAHPPVLRAMERLARQGLSRHDCLHAIAWVLAHHFHELMTTDTGSVSTAVQARYDAAVERLTANGWRAQLEE